VQLAELAGIMFSKKSLEKVGMPIPLSDNPLKTSQHRHLLDATTLSMAIDLQKKIAKTAVG
jgi:hypothetical protein